MRRWLVSLGLPILGAIALLLAVIGLGRWASVQLRDQERFTLAIADIACTPPPGQSAADFLGEVQYLAGWPDRLRLLDESLPKQLADGFAHHPWVEKVNKVAVRGSGVRVHLTFRAPVLAIQRPGADGPIRAVDGLGILLPLAAVTADLPLLDAIVPASAGAGAVGLPIDDPCVEAAAQTVALLWPHQPRLNVNRVAVKENEVYLTSRNGRIFWGRPPGKEREGEPPAPEKIKRLLAWIDRPEGDCDLRK